MRLFVLAFASWVYCVSVPADCAEWYVDGSVAESGDGTSWETAFKTIQEGINAAGHGDTVTVAPGVYTGTGNKDLRYNGKSITLASRDGADTTIVDCDGYGQGVIFDSGETSQCVLRGFTIKNGLGGIRCLDSTPQIIECILTRNSGSGIHCDSSADASIVDCVFSYNERGITLVDSGPTITRCSVLDNYFEGVKCSNHASPDINTCTVRNNSPGLVFGYGASGRVEYCTITGNTGGADQGGGITCLEGSPQPQIQGCLICYNSAVRGGGLQMRDALPPIVNCVIAKNSADDGGGIYMENSPTSIINCTIVENSDGSGIDCRNASVTATNTILWGNWPSEIKGTAQLRYCNVRGGWVGAGNISDDPFPYFMKPAKQNYRLHPNSPCVDAGTQNPEVVQLPETDILAIVRIMYGGKAFKVDMGAYEFHIWAPTVDPGIGNPTLKWSTLADKTYSIYYSGDMLTWELLAGDVASMGNTVTIWKDPTAPLPSSDLRRRYYKVLENE